MHKNYIFDIPWGGRNYSNCDLPCEPDILRVGIDLVETSFGCRRLPLAREVGALIKEFILVFRVIPFIFGTGTRDARDELSE